MVTSFAEAKLTVTNRSRCGVHALDRPVKERVLRRQLIGVEQVCC